MNRAHDSPRRHLRPAFPEDALEEARNGDRGVRHLREPHPTIRVRAERLDKRPEFPELGNERDPIIGAQDGTLEYKIPKRPIRKKIQGLPAFTTVRGAPLFSFRA